MTHEEKELRDRLSHFWEAPDFSPIFATKERKPHHMKKGTLLFNEGDPVSRMYYIHEGFIKTYRISEDGRDTMNYIIGPKHMLGFRSLLSKEHESQYSAEAITDLIIYSLSHDEYLESVAKHPVLLVDLIHAYAEGLSYTERKLEGFIYSSTTSRVAIFLADCARRFGKHKKSGVSIPFQLTHQKIADFVGSFRETVTLAINKLEEESILEIQRGDVIIYDMKKLQKYASFGKKR